MLSVDSDSRGTKKPFTGHAKSNLTKPFLQSRFLIFLLGAMESCRLSFADFTIWRFLEADAVIAPKMPSYFANVIPPQSHFSKQSVILV